MRLRLVLACAAIGGAAVSAVSAAPAGPPDIIGRWVIAKADLAPWADPQQRGGPAEARRLVGSLVTFAPHAVTGPAPLGCGKATYVAHQDTADLLFEGSLAEPDRNGKPRNAVALARAFGMTTKTVETVETSCSEVAYHRFARDTLVFGLNNRIYTLHPVPAGR